MNACGYIQNNIDNEKNIFHKYICQNKIIFHYYWIEGVISFLKDFKIFGANKKILILSPFSKSIEYQIQPERLNNLLKDYKFPECTIKTYNTPITYNNSEEQVNIDTNNWLEQCAKMEDDISKIDFDIALLSCGSYANCLGAFISKSLNRKAIYLGGILNILFNIYGKRYDIDSYKQFINLEYRIEALEKEEYINIKGGRKLKNESFNAYF
jgi:hypothetical protein